MLGHYLLLLTSYTKEQLLYPPTERKISGTNNEFSYFLNTFKKMFPEYINFYHNSAFFPLSAFQSILKRSDVERKPRNTNRLCDSRNQSQSLVLRKPGISVYVRNCFKAMRIHTGIRDPKNSLNGNCSFAIHVLYSQCRSVLVKICLPVVFHLNSDSP